MIKRTPKTDEQLYIDWASEDVKALQKLLEYKAPAKGVITKTDLNEKEYAKLKAAFTKKNSVPCSQEEGTL